ncbi:hypothetical protein ABK040_002122 [Willaertia magna]
MPNYSLFTLLLFFIFSFTNVYCQLTEQEKQQMVQYHNNYRFSPLLSPKPSNMQSVAWEDKLANVAVNYAATCTWAHNGQRSTQYGSTIGENLYIAKGITNIVNASVASWFEEISFYDYTKNACVGGECLHYTQLVWAATTKIGCSKQVCSTVKNLDTSWNGATIIVCNYYTAGNYAGQKPYIAASTSGKTSNPVRKNSNDGGSVKYNNTSVFLLSLLFVIISTILF